MKQNKKKQTKHLLSLKNNQKKNLLYSVPLSCWVIELPWILLARRCLLPSLIAPHTLQQLLCKKFHLNPILSAQVRVWNWGFQKCLKHKPQRSWTTSGLRNSSVFWGSLWIWRTREGKKPTQSTPPPKLFYFSRICLLLVTLWGLDMMIWMIPWFCDLTGAVNQPCLFRFLGNLFSRSGMDFNGSFLMRTMQELRTLQFLGQSDAPAFKKKKVNSQFWVQGRTTSTGGNAVIHSHMETQQLWHRCLAPAAHPTSPLLEKWHF